MLPIERFAYCNGLREIHPGEKFLLTGCFLLTCLALNAPVVSGLVLLTMTVITLRQGKIPLGFYLKLLSVPLFFLVAGTVTIAVNILPPQAPALWSWQWGGFKLGVTASSLLACAKLILRSLAAVTCLYFLALTTPLIEIIGILKKLKIPPLFIELMSLVYRYLFIGLATAAGIYTAQTARQGYSCLKNSYRSLGLLASNLLVRSQHRAQELYTALEARGYQGTVDVLEQTYPISIKNLLLIAVAEVLLILAYYLSGGN
ncbi:cobalt ECF transporter T component CbiQ [Desulfotomaculum varum]